MPAPRDRTPVLFRRLLAWQLVAALRVGDAHATALPLPLPVHADQVAGIVLDVLS
jgi:hypothetical protein